MPSNGISEQARNFIFESIDSIEVLEILLLFFSNPERTWTALAVSKELRFNPNSVNQRICRLEALRLVVKTDSGTFKYRTENAMDPMVQEVAHLYKDFKHRIFELIYSPMKKARDFADAFKLGGGKGEEGGENG